MGDSSGCFLFKVNFDLESNAWDEHLNVYSVLSRLVPCLIAVFLWASSNWDPNHHKTRFEVHLQAVNCFFACHLSPLCHPVDWCSVASSSDVGPQAWNAQSKSLLWNFFQPLRTFVVYSWSRTGRNEVAFVLPIVPYEFSDAAQMESLNLPRPSDSESCGSDCMWLHYKRLPALWQTDRIWWWRSTIIVETFAGDR